MGAPDATKQQKQRKAVRAYVRQQNKRSNQEAQEIKELEEVIAAGAPAPGTNPLSVEAPTPGCYAGVRRFEELPLSRYTKDGLKEGKFVKLTAIQRAALPHAIAGRDILGAAKTGSGKTLTFLIPVVEKLYRLKWTQRDGLGALVLTPTRELAIQIFQELRKIGKHHDLSAGLLIGGKDVKEESKAVSSMNILVATPGRLLQHMDTTPGFDTSQLQILVLDEADRILDMGFATTLDAIISGLPQERQTLLFSATQTKSVKDLARLSLSDPEYLAVHSDAQQATPLKLQQAYAVVKLGDKMDVVWSFVRSHVKAKTIVFLSTCKQARFVYEAFRKLRPGVPVRALHGSMKQMKRMKVYYEFCEAKAMVLFATDVAARGLDFPTVDWVLQMDCPEDAAAYIHRVGRTARYLSAGRALLLLTPEEKEGMLGLLEGAKVPVQQIKINPKKAQPVGPAVQALLSKSTELKEFAQRAVVAYARSIFLQPNKEVFDVTRLQIADYAASLGLLTVPKLRFLKKVGKKVQEVVVGGQAEGQQQGEELGDLVAANGEGKEAGKRKKQAKEETDGEGEEEQRPAKKRKGADGETKGAAGAKTRKQQEQKVESEEAEDSEEEGSAGKDDVTAEARQRAASGSGSDSDDDDFLRVKQRDVFGAAANGSGDGDEAGAEEGGLSTALDAALAAASGSKGQKKKRLKIRTNRASGSRVVFDEEGQAVDPLQLLATAELGRGSEDGEDEGGEDGEEGEGLYVVKSKPQDRFRKAAEILKKRDRDDKAALKELRKKKRSEAKARLKDAEAEGSEDWSEEEEGTDEEGPVRGFRVGGGGAALQRRKGGSAAGDDESGSSDGGDDDASSSDDDEREERGRGRGAAGGQEVAHMGMARKGGKGEGAKGGAAGVGGAGDSLAEQEALALRLLRGG